MRLVVAAAFLLACCVAGRCAAVSETRQFLYEHRHAWLPYPLPAETNMAEVQKVIDLGFDTVGLCFAGPYNGGKMDFTKLDEAIEAVAKAGQRVVLQITPRFYEHEGISDTLASGKVIPNVWNRNPNYCMVDPFNPRQRKKFTGYIELCAKRYGRDKRIAAFVVGWGYQGETGFFNGDWNTDPALLGSDCGGYSRYALAQFNKWRSNRNLPVLRELPLPSEIEQSDDYILFHRFRYEFARDVFQSEMIAAVKAHSDYPVGIYAYIPGDTNSYARNWTSTPNADFYRSATTAASYDLTRTLLDSGIGWEEAWLHDGKWNYTAACMERDEARQIAKGGVFHAMYIRIYNTEPQWEKGVFEKVVSFLKTQDLAKKVRRSRPVVALYQPTWGASALPARSAAQKFLPKIECWQHILKMIGLTESFGLPYQLVTESDLLEPSRLSGFKHIIVPMWDYLPRVLGQSRYNALAKDARVLPIPMKDRALTRSEFREILKRAKIETFLDFDSDKILAGRTYNLVFNWDEQPIRVKVPERNDEIELRGYQYVFLER